MSLKDILNNKNKHIESLVAGFEKDFRECMKKAEEVYLKVKKKFPNEAQYVIPMAFNKRLLMTMNLRELFHFIQLRSGKTGHISYRRIAQQMFKAIKEVHPLMAKYIKCDLS